MENTVQNDFTNWKSKAAKFLTGQAVSLFGSALVQFAIIWHITLTTKSGLFITLSSICGFLPQGLISVFGGVWADRFSRKKIIILADTAIAVSTLIMAVLFLAGYDSIWLMIVVLVIRSLGSGVQSPAVNALIPQLVPEAKLARVNGINGSIQSLVLFVAPAVSGALMNFAALEYIFLTDVFTAAIGVALLLTIHIPLHRKAAENESIDYFADVREGVRYIRMDKFLRNLMGYYFLFGILVVPAAMLTPLMIARSFGDEVWRLTANEMLFFAGAVLGGIIISAWGGFKNRTYTIALSGVLFGVTGVLLGLAGNFYLYLSIMFVCGIFMPFYSTTSTVLFQEKVNPNMLGRVFSLVQIMSLLSMPIGLGIFGFAADYVEIEYLLILSGTLMAIEGIIMFLDKNFKAT